MGGNEYAAQLPNIPELAKKQIVQSEELVRDDVVELYKTLSDLVSEKDASVRTEKLILSRAHADSIKATIDMAVQAAESAIS